VPQLTIFIGIWKPHIFGLVSKHPVPFANVPITDGRVTFVQPARYALQCCIPGEIDGIMVPPLPMNRIHLPPILVLNNGPLSHAPPIPEVPTLRDGSFTTAWDKHGGSSLIPPLPT
jgi:hypothetical protein